MLYCQITPIVKTLGQFENLVFVIMSTRENIRLIARSSLDILGRGSLGDNLVIHTKYQGSRPYSFRQEEFFYVFPI